MRPKRTRSESEKLSETHSRAKRSKPDESQIPQGDQISVRETQLNHDTSPTCNVEASFMFSPTTAPRPANQAKTYPSERLDSHVTSSKIKPRLPGIESSFDTVSETQDKQTNRVETFETSTIEPILIATTEPSQQSSSLLVSESEQSRDNCGTQSQQASQVDELLATSDQHRDSKQTRTSTTEPLQQSSEPPVRSETQETRNQQTSQAQEFRAKEDEYHQAEDSWIVQQVSVRNKCQRFRKEPYADANRLTMCWETAKSIERVRSLPKNTTVMMNDTYEKDSK
jgi:hypothetical protein